MKKFILATGLSVVMTGCALLSPYQITFSTKENEAVNPKEDTLNLVISSPALAYVSSYKCGDAPEVTVLPVLKDEMVAQMAQYLDLNFLADQVPETLCEINVTAYDRTTTSTAGKKISVYMYSKPVLKASEDELCGGIAAIQCGDGLNCKIEDDYPDAGGLCVKEVVEVTVPEVTEQTETKTETGEITEKAEVSTETSVVTTEQ